MESEKKKEDLKEWLKQYPFLEEEEKELLIKWLQKCPALEPDTVYIKRAKSQGNSAGINIPKKHLGDLVEIRILEHNDLEGGD